MREILFRGKRTDSGEWVEGNHLYDDMTGKHYIVPFDNITENMCVGFEVIPETVGQYTGLDDKNGKKVFKGDILEFEDCSKDGDGVTNFFTNAAEVVFCNGRFEFGHMKYYGETSAIYAYCGGHAEMMEFFRCSAVVGNIHDNPEMLEVKEWKD